MATRSLGTLTLDVIAKIGGFEQGMDKAARISEKRLKQIATQASALGNTIGTYLTRGIDTAVKVLGELFDAASGFQDLAEKVGDTAEAVASLKAASDVSNVSLDTVAAASIKLTAALSKVDDESKGVGKALAAIGLNLDDFKKLSPVEQIDAVAKALNRFEDGAAKTAVAVALFGKSGAELIPFLNDLADGAERQITLTQEQIEAADEFSKAIDRTKGQINTFALKVAGDLVPTLNTTLTTVKDLTSEFGEFSSVGTTIREWAENAVLAFATVAEAVVGLIKALRAAAGSFESFFADLAVLDQLNPAATIKSFVLGEGNDLEKAFKERQRIAAEANQRYIDLWNYSGTAVTDSLRKAFNEQKGLVDQSARLLSSVTNSLPSSGSGIPFRPGVTQTEQAIPFRSGLGPQTRQQLEFSAAVEKTEKATKKAKTEAEKLAESIQSVIDKLKEQDETFGKTSAQTEIYALQQLGASEAQIQYAQSLADSIDAKTKAAEVEKYLDNLREEAATVEATTEQTNAYKLSVLGATQAQIDEARQLSESIDKQKEMADLRKEATRIIENSLTPLQAYQEEIKKLNELMSLGLLTQEQYNSAVIAAQDAYDKARVAADPWAKEMQAIADQAARNIQDAFADFLFDPFSAGLDGMLKGFADTLQRMAAQAAAAQIFQGLSGFFGGAGGGGFWESLLSGSGSFGSSNFGGGLATGGPVMPGKTYLVGEEGPELFKSNTAGSIIPNGQIGGTNININIPVSAPTGSVGRATLDQIQSAAFAGAQMATARNR